MMNINIISLEETEKLAKIVAESIVNKKLLITLSGDLASGKTTFTKYLAKYLGISDVVTSPTFNILKEYDTDSITLYHIDAYRLENSEEDLGFEDVFYSDAVCVVEWAEFIIDYLPIDRLDINIKNLYDKRVFNISCQGEKYNYILKEIETKW